MKAKFIFLLAYFLGVFACYSNAQSVDELKKQVNTIKKSSDYIYGQAAGEDETVTYKIAYETFLQKVKTYIQNNPALKDAEAVLLPTINSKVKKISFERYINSKVVCLYINKKDIVPLYKDNIIAVNDKEFSNSLQITKDTVFTEKVSFAEKSNSIKADLNSNQGVEISDVSEEKIESLVSKVEYAISITDEKTSLLLTDISNAGNFDAINGILQQRKTEHHDIMFKPTMDFNINNAFWAIFDRTKKLIALLDKEKRTDLLTNTPIDISTYKDKPKIWIQIY